LIGVYQSIYLLSTGVSLRELALFQVVFSLVSLFANIPIGVMCDRYGRKLLVIIGVLSTIIFYLLCFFSPNFYFLVLAHIFYAVGICCVGNGIFGWMYSSIENKEELARYSHIGQKITSIGSIITGLIGAIILYYTKSYYVGYFVSIFFMSIILYIYMYIPTPIKAILPTEKKQSFLFKVKSVFPLINQSTGGLYFIIITCLFTFGIQIIYHFWQPIMTYGMSTEAISKDKIFVLICCHIGAFLFQFLFNHILPSFGVFTKKYMVSTIICGVLGGMFCILLLFKIQSSTAGYIGIFIYSLIHGTTSFLSISTGGYYTFLLKKEYEKDISSISSGVAIYARLAAVISLFLVSLFPSSIPVYYYLIIPAISFILCGLISFKWFRSKN
ncbi:MFS transporter, partial [Gilliamella sp. CG16]|uniref:MFS transporter n=1 Tax=Gilliamella sp. CG16 TaxID=3351503 RepID=UPI003987281E